MEELIDQAEEMGDDVFYSTVATGVITDVWLYHGVQVDLGLEFDGCVGREATASRVLQTDRSPVKISGFEEQPASRSKSDR